MNVVLPQHAYTHPQQLPLHFNSPSGKLLYLVLQSSSEANKRWVSKQARGPLRQGLSNKAGDTGGCLMLQCFPLTQAIKVSKEIEGLEWIWEIQLHLCS